MVVGEALALVGQTQSTNDAMYRKSGGSEEVVTGTAEITNIKGNTVAWNQFVNRFHIASEVYGITRESREHGLHYSGTCTKKAGFTGAYFSVTPINTHKYYISAKGVPDTCGLSFGSAYGVDSYVGTFNDASIGVYIQEGVTIDADVYFSFIDLTLIYGAGNEPSTAAQFEADYEKWFGKPLTYEPYDEGSLRSVQLDAIKTTGFNQYNNGSAKVIGGLQYQITGTYTGINLGEETITPDANGLFTPSTTGTLTIVGGGGDTCVHISGDRNGEYEPYEEHIAPLPVTTLKGKLNGEGESVVVFPDGLKSAGSVYDEIYSTGGKTYAIKRVGAVDLGSKTWKPWSGQRPDYGIWEYFSADPSMKQYTESQVGNLVCHKYVTTNRNSITNRDSNTGIIAQRNGIVILKDLNYITDAATFKTAMNGVYLYYELETPLVYEVENFTLPKPYVVNGDGTEEQVQKQGVQGVASTLTCSYGMDAVKTLMNLPQRFVSAAEEQNFSESQKVLARRNIGVEEILAHKANQEGVYEGLTVGLANNLRGDTIVDAEFYRRKSGGTQSVTSGIAAIKEVKGKSIVWNQLLNEGKLVDMGLPSGTLWASCNIDITQPDGFAVSPFQYDCSFFSWGNVDGHNPISTSAFDYDFGGVNAQEPWYEGQPYSETQGNTLTGNIPVGDTYDAARVNVGTLWRMPTNGEYGELFANIIYINADGTEVDTTKADKRVTVNGIVGLYIQSKINGARLFFSCSGYGYGSSWSNRGSYGYYWSSTFYSSRVAQGLGFYSGGVNPQDGSYRYSGFAVRPVINKTVIDNGKGGHKYAQYNNNISDLTLMFGAGNEPNSVAEFEKMFPLNYYAYNAGEVIPFAGENLVTTGFNQWDGNYTAHKYVNMNGDIQNSNGWNVSGYINVLPNEEYCINYPMTQYGPCVAYYDINKNYKNRTFISSATTNYTFRIPDNIYYIRVNINDINLNNFCINISNPDKNGTYEPYEKHTLPLDPSQWRDKNGDLVFPYGGMHGVGTAFDYAKVDADGYIRKVTKKLGAVNLGSLTWEKGTLHDNTYFKTNAAYDDIKAASSNSYVYENIICSIFNKMSYGSLGGATPQECIGVSNSKRLGINSNSRASLSADQFKTAMSGVTLYYELAEPVEVELATPVYANYYVNGGGTEAIEPDNGAAPYTSPANLSILYAMDARGEINNLPKNYLSKESAENMLGAMQTAGIIGGYTMTFDAATNRYVFTITAPAAPNV